MIIEVFYVPGCPNHQPAIKAVTSALALESLQSEICEIPVQTHDEVRACRFPGSPTIRVNGSDVEPESTSDYGLTCRLYANGLGIPSELAIRRAISAARQRE